MEQTPDWLRELYTDKPPTIITIILDDISKDIRCGGMDYYPEIVSPTKIYSCSVCEMLFSAPSQKKFHMKTHENK